MKEINIDLFYSIINKIIYDKEMLHSFDIVEVIIVSIGFSDPIIIEKTQMVQLEESYPIKYDVLRKARRDGRSFLTSSNQITIFRSEILIYIRDYQIDDLLSGPNR